MIDAKEEVMTTRLTDGAFFLMAFKIPVVPTMAGSRRSFLVSVTLLKVRGQQCLDLAAQPLM